MFARPVNVGTFTTGQTGWWARSPESCMLFDRQTLLVEIAYQNEDDFVKNFSTLRAEERIALTIPAPGGLIKGSGLTMAASAANEPQPHPTHGKK